MSVSLRAGRTPGAVPVGDAGCATRVTHDGDRGTRRPRPAGHPRSGVAMTAEHRRLEAVVGELVQTRTCYAGLTLPGAWYDGPGIAAGVRSRARTATSCRPVAGSQCRVAS